MTETIQDIKAGLDSLKTRVTGLKARAAKLNTMRDELMRQAGNYEQTRAQAVAELTELGITLPDLNLSTLEAGTLDTNTKLQGAIDDLEAVLTNTEALCSTQALIQD